MILPRHYFELKRRERFSGSPEDEATSGVLSEIADAVLISLSVLSLPALWGSLARSGSMGWHPVMSMQAALLLTIWLATVFRRRLSYQIRAWFGVVVIALVGVGGIHAFGLMAASTSWIPFAGV